MAVADWSASRHRRFSRKLSDVVGLRHDSGVKCRPWAVVSVVEARRTYRRSSDGCRVWEGPRRTGWQDESGLRQLGLLSAGEGLVPSPRLPLSLKHNLYLYVNVEHVIQDIVLVCFKHHQTTAGVFLRDCWETEGPWVNHNSSTLLHPVADQGYFEIRGHVNYMFNIRA